METLTFSYYFAYNFFRKSPNDLILFFLRSYTQLSLIQLLEHNF